jgi:hypothetical protein
MGGMLILPPAVPCEPIRIPPLRAPTEARLAEIRKLLAELHRRSHGETCAEVGGLARR